MDDNSNKEHQSAGNTADAVARTGDGDRVASGFELDLGGGWWIAASILCWRLPDIIEALK